MKTGLKLTLGFLAVAAIAGTIGLIGIVNLRGISVSGTNMYEKQTLAISYLLAMDEGFQRTRINIRELVIANTDEERASFAQSIAAMTDQIERNQGLYAKTIQTDTGQKLFDAFVLARKAYAAQIDQALELDKQGKDGEASAIILGPGRAAARAVQEAVDGLVKRKSENAAQTAGA